MAEQGYGKPGTSMDAPKQSMENVQELVRQADELFTARQPLLSLWQSITENFYPERADYTVSRSIGEEFADNLTTSYPILARRELGSLISTMLRPSDKEWMEVSIYREDLLDQEGRVWLERARDLQKRAMYDRQALFVRATKEADNDFVSIGQCVISCELSYRTNSLLYRCWHPRDVVWRESIEGKINFVARRWKPTCREVKAYFNRPSDSFCQAMQDKLGDMKKRGEGCAITHVVIDAEEYESATLAGKKYRTRFVSLYIDTENKHIIREEPINHMIYVIPRWQTVSGSQYAYSPCTVAALPDARLIQAMTFILLDAGEKASSPPMIATTDAIRSDVNLFANGITWVDRDYDERNGDPLRPLDMKFDGIPLGIELRADVKSSIMEAFYLNKISMPPPSNGEMTAYEVGRRVEEYVRNALPLFEPMETDYNGALCEHTFQILMDAGAFGSAHDLPDSLRGQDIVFKFQSPLHDAIDRQKGHTFLEAKAMLTEAAQLDPSVAPMLDVQTMMRDVLSGIGAPETWINSDEKMKEKATAAAKQAETQNMMGQVAMGAQAAEQVGKATKAMTEAQM